MIVVSATNTSIDLPSSATCRDPVMRPLTSVVKLPQSPWPPYVFPTAGGQGGAGMPGSKLQVNVSCWPPEPWRSTVWTMNIPSERKASVVSFDAWLGSTTRCHTCLPSAPPGSIFNVPSGGGCWVDVPMVVEPDWRMR